MGGFTLSPSASLCIHAMHIEHKWALKERVLITSHNLKRFTSKYSLRVSSFDQMGSGRMSGRHAGKRILGPERVPHTNLALKCLFWSSNMSGTFSTTWNACHGQYELCKEQYKEWNFKSEITWWKSLPLLLPSPLKSTWEKRQRSRCLSASGPWRLTI